MAPFLNTFLRLHNAVVPYSYQREAICNATHILPPPPPPETKT